jgi:hypothetical protein
MKSGRVMDCKYLGDVSRSTQPGSAAVDPLLCAWNRISATQKTSGGNCGHEYKMSIDSSTMGTRKLC